MSDASVFRGAPVDIAGQLATGPFLGRKSERVDVRIGAGLRQRGAGAVDVRILDLSVHGFRASTHLDLAPGADVWLRLPGLEGWQARVAWKDGPIIGCAFDRPLHPAVLATVIGGPH